jgi:hypothetical protein
MISRLLGIATIGQIGDHNIIDQKFIDICDSVEILGKSRFINHFKSQECELIGIQSQRMRLKCKWYKTVTECKAEFTSHFERAAHVLDCNPRKENA